MNEIAAATPERLERARLAALLRAEGKTGTEIAVLLGVSRSYASALLTDPDGSKAHARKLSYSGRCVDCGASTSGSNGPGRAPQRCADCSQERQHAQRIWTRETVIDAIQRFAAANGRPPKADEWIYADHVNHYPPRSAVYGSHRHNPFPAWADAIEAAGFPRPLLGFYVRDETHRMLMSDARIVWTRGKIIAAIHDWVAKHGEVPSYNDWRHTAGDDHPHSTTVTYRFGSMGNAIRAAGYTPRRQGQHKKAA